MNNFKIQISLFLITLVVTGCITPPEFSDTPKISFNDLKFHDSSQGADSLVLRFDFEDGDGDIGLEATETYRPYHPYNLIIDFRDSLVTYSDPNVVPPFYLVDPRGASLVYSEDDNRPIYNCSQYQIGSYQNGPIDTFFIEKNEYHNNLHITFERKRQGQYTEIDFASSFANANCAVVDFDGRIPIFDQGSLGKSLNGTITYAMLSAGFPTILKLDTFRLTFYAYDRDLNKSNIIVSPDVTLPQITVEVN
ncbi:MAG: hypothetical protein ACI83W_000574 [Marinoscillum sp.]|jgi:hypothetical protein